MGEIKDGMPINAMWSVAGPIFFGGVAWVMYGNYEKKMKTEKENNVA